jgi:serine protease Do
MNVMNGRRKGLVVFLAGLLVGWAVTADAASPNIARQLGNAFADAVERVMPSVVVIRTEGTVYHAARDLFFGDVYGIPEKLMGQGSGVIISRDGHVLTSNHVIENADEIEVVLHDGTKYPAKLVGRDPRTDLAVLKINAPDGAGFTAVEPGDSDAVRVGEFAIAIGSPFSLNSSVTVGIVSQKGRSVGVLPYEDFIQTDASINVGNSGGPLVDVDGRMIGINAVIQTESPYSRGSIGIGFAVPANVAMRVAKAIIQSGGVDRPWLGVQLMDLEHLSNELPADRLSGAAVGEVFGNTPAAKCGLRAGDIITAVDETPVTNVRAVQRAIFKREVGETVKLNVRRGEKDILFEIVTERMPDVGESEP